MKTKMLAVCFALVAATAFADSIPSPVLSFPLTGIGYGIDSSAEPLVVLYASGVTSSGAFSLRVSNDTGSSQSFTGGYIYAQQGNVFLSTDSIGLFNSSISNGVLSGTFKGIELERLGNQDWVYYIVTGNYSIGLNMTSATGTGTITITDAVFEGKAFVGPEPGTLTLMGTGLCGVVSVVGRKLKKKPDHHQS
jgi:hypothetical protein